MYFFVLLISDENLPIKIGLILSAIFHDGAFTTAWLHPWLHPVKICLQTVSG